MIFSVFQKNQVLGYSWSTLLWHRCYYPHRSRDALSPVCGICLKEFWSIWNGWTDQVSQKWIEEVSMKWIDRQNARKMKMPLKWKKMYKICSRPGQSQGLLYKQPCHSLINWFSQPVPPTSLRCRHAQTVRDSTSSYKIGYVIVIKNFLQNPISGLKDTAILLKGLILSLGGASSGEGLRLQPAQQAGFQARKLIYLLNSSGSPQCFAFDINMKLRFKRKVLKTILQEFMGKYTSKGESHETSGQPNWTEEQRDR